MQNCSSVRTLMRAIIAPDSSRPTVRLPQYTLTHTPAGAGCMPRASVSSVYSHWPALSSSPVYKKKSSMLSHADGNNRVRIIGALATGSSWAASTCACHRVRVNPKQPANTSCATPTIRYPHRHDSPALITLLITSGPVAAPRPNDACSQFTVRGLKFSAA